ncbi:uncharacterized protein LOC110032701 isoform X2 [Phalaenopsis equestris]|uniref:uncharacterized protein LOC110032701 isoform X2 n=1 Tax=Phalaenopsis equestris TaxID=78828 RepID=UPI0009E5D523|nr:uncharacterized protein LOC110032701 isoform X2 [Phalaenopsis equestris]XP_020592071.1 uncharacterized protein LOC110032701 isoform X2 [Phalaenopsis equestris]XP_020592072.1 uncharacterized protein LOC110032701 isoform X2 [Phalaenopsis equestris]
MFRQDRLLKTCCDAPFASFLLPQMDIRDAEEILCLLDSCISAIKWRLRPSAKRRLETDVLALCTRLRAVVMVDYGGKMPELQDHLRDLLSSMRKECTLLLPLNIMIIEDMIYMVHVEGMAELSNLSLQQRLHFVNLEADPPQLILQTNQTLSMSEFVSVQKLFSSIFPCNAVVNTIHGAMPSSMDQSVELLQRNTNLASIADLAASQQCEIIDLTSFLKDMQITIPALNGWLLGYPVVYLFRKEHAADAVYNLSTKYLHIYKIVICRLQTPSRKACEEELLSFSVPYELSLEREKEAWAEAFFAHMLAKFETCKQVWSRIRLEVEEALHLCNT